MSESAAPGAPPKFTPHLPAPRRGWEGWSRPHSSPILLAPEAELGAPAFGRTRGGRRLLHGALLVARDLAIVLLLFLLVRATVESFSVDGFSMQPTLQDRDRVLVNKFSYLRIDPSFLGWIPVVGDELSKERFLIHGPRRGDIVVFDDPRFQGEEIVKRVVGLPGETVEIRQGNVYVNGRRLEEPYLDIPWFENRPAVFVTPGHYFVLGDNRTASVDSRSIGPVPRAAIVGKLSLVYWPPARFTIGPNLPLGDTPPHLQDATPQAVAQPAR